MKFFPANKQERWMLLIFPFKTYVVLAPVFFFVWDTATEGYRFRGARETAATIIAFGDIFCLFIFVVAGLILLVARWRNVTITTFLVALATFIMLIFWLPMCATA